MDTEKWAVLLAASDSGSLSAAAEALGYTPSGVSRVIAGLEQETGFPLLVRHRRGVSPTRECQELLPTVREAVHLAETLRQQTDQFRGLERGELAVGTTYHACYPWLGRTIARFTKVHPGITFHFLEGLSSDLCQAVTERRADFCVVSYREGDFCWLPLFEDPLLALVSCAHPLARAAAFPLEAFAREPFICIHPGQETDNSRLFSRYGIRPNTRFTTTDSAAALAMVEAGLGVTLVNGLVCRNLSPQLRALPLDPPQMIRVGAAYSASPTPAARQFLRFVRQNAFPAQEEN